MTEQTEAVARAFVTARRAARVLETYPGERPTDMDMAYAIQDRAIAIDGRPVTGWKVGRINPPLDARLGSNRLAGPIFANTVVDATVNPDPAMPVFVGGFAAAEAELLLHVAPGWDGAVPVDDAGTRALLDDVRLGMEIASSPYPGINADGPAVTASDFGNNAGLVIGAALEGWQAIDLCAILVRTQIDGATIGEATAATMLDGPYGAVRFLLANLAGRGIDASAGLWVSTGAITGVHPVLPGQAVRAVFGDHGAVDCHIVPAAGAA
ncbi:2-keto-4-pentenoate hydratase [Sphingobium sp. JS3065]|uniref:2-keto-4-pentenoate hydratase n=1 Tax=Sphingobium sp. JS3065 TaxID=2970925 RepID=UPI0022651ED0|nr:2-keto-4-pentenoate hydratase [Sphingobium sp. JS3065]UZW57728.1 2-keto-4-pentenoate hydratase [Sphingobium sp. JS3065]